MSKNSLPFLTLCNAFEEVSAASKPKKSAILRSFIAEYSKKIDSKDQNETLYPVLRLMLPELDRERAPYRLKEFALAKTLINILCLDPDGSDAKLLKNYKTSSNTHVKDFCDAAFTVLKKNFSSPSKLSIHDVNHRLDIIADKAGKDIRKQEEEILKLFESTAAIEQKWILRIVLKEMKLGIGHTGILGALHKDAINLFNSNSSLVETCKILRDPNTKLNEIEISLFRPFRPMLSLRCDAKEINKCAKNNCEFIVENKFDGERFQLHMKHGRFKYFSRRGFEYTNTYGDSYGCHGCFTNSLTGVFDESVESVVLDGEMMIWNKQSRSFGSKGLEIDIKNLKPDHRTYQPCFCVFDLLYLNGKVLCNNPLRERKALLDKIVKPKQGVVLVSKFELAKCKLDVIKALNESMDRKEEGIVFKDPNSTYVPNVRIGWWKMKLEYFEGVMADLDVIIMGGYYGSGRQVTGFLVGVVDKTDANAIKYLSFAKISTGLSRSELDTLSDALKAHWMPVSGKTHEQFGLFWSKEIPDVFVKPEHSCCLLVRGSELTRNYGTHPHFKARYSPRFARIQSIRMDKPCSDCLSTDELNALTESSTSIVKLNKRHLELTDVENQLTVKRRKKPEWEGLREVESKSDILENREFLVLSGKGAWTKDDVETAIRENGGSVVLAEADETFCMLVGDEHMRTRTYKGSVDIVNLEWLRGVLNEGEFSMYTPHDTVYVSPKRKLDFMRRYDRFGDSYTEKATVKSLKYIVENVDLEQNNSIYLMPSEIKALNAEMGFRDVEKPYLGCIAYFDKYKIINDSQSKELPLNLFDEINFINGGGIICDIIDKTTNVIFTTTDDVDRVGELELYLRAIRNTQVKVLQSPEQLLSI